MVVESSVDFLFRITEGQRFLGSRLQNGSEKRDD